MRFGVKRKRVFETLAQRRLLTAVTTLIENTGIRYQATVLAANDSGLLIEGRGRYDYKIHHTDGRSIANLTEVAGFEDFIDLPARDVHVVGDHWVYVEPLKIPLEAEPNFVPAPRHLASNGTIDGTFSVTELLPQSQSVSFVGGFGELAVFRVQTPEHGDELWSVDLQARSAQVVSDLATGTESNAFDKFFADDKWL